MYNSSLGVATFRPSCDRSRYPGAEQRLAHVEQYTFTLHPPDDLAVVLPTRMTFQTLLQAVCYNLGKLHQEIKADPLPRRRRHLALRCRLIAILRRQPFNREYRYLTALAGGAATYG